MELASIRTALRRTPFLPFQVRLADGRALEVPHPDFLMIEARSVTHTHHETGAWTVIEPLLIISLDYRGVSPPASEELP